MIAHKAGRPEALRSVFRKHISHDAFFKIISASLGPLFRDLCWGMKQPQCNPLWGHLFGRPNLLNCSLSSGGLGWVGSWLALQAGSHGQCVLPSPSTTGSNPAVCSHSPLDCCLTKALVRGRYRRACVYVTRPQGPWGGVLGTGSGHSSTPFVSIGLRSSCQRVGGGWVCPVLQAPAAGQGSPTPRLLGESVGQVSCGFLQPTTEPQRGARGVWSKALVD